MIVASTGMIATSTGGNTQVVAVGGWGCRQLIELYYIIKHYILQVLYRHHKTDCAKIQTANHAETLEGLLRFYSNATS